MAQDLEDEDSELSLDVTEDDLGDDVSADSTVTWGTDWTVGTIIDQLTRGRFDLEPAFQRRDVWSDIKRSRFIESLLLGIPVPQLILAERKDARGQFIVLDGKQRLRSIQRFAGLDGTPMRLKGLEVLKELNGVTYENLRSSSDLDAHSAALDNQAIRAVVMRGWKNEALLYLTFLRLNSNVVGLSPQELRRALHHGPFMDFVMQYSSDSLAIRSFLKIKNPDFRMRDAEVLIRHIALSSRLNEYKGNLRKFLDDTCQIGNSNWDTFRPAVVDYAEGLDEAIEFTFEIFGSNAFKRAVQKGYETRRNRAVLDVMAYYFQDPDVRDQLDGKHSDVQESYERLCRKNVEFSDYLTTTTKSTSAVLGRLRIWGTELAKLAPAAADLLPTVGE